MNVLSIQEWLNGRFGISSLPEEIKEHDSIAEFRNCPDELCKLFHTEEVKPFRKLGLHLDYSVRNCRLSCSLKSWYYIGCVWILKSDKEKVYAQVKPKKNVDFISMIKEIWENQNTKYYFLNSRERIFWFSLREPLIALNRIEPPKELIVFSLLSFIGILDSIVRKGLKKDYLTKVENLNGSIKGKILPKKSLQRNFLRGSFTKVFCKFHVLSLDTLENQILKFTLRLILKNLLKSKLDIPRELEEKLLYLLSYFRDVSSVKVTTNTFRKVTYSGFYPEYREAIHLAKLILEGLGFDFGGDSSERKIKIFPYVIDMPKLYELYVWQWLEKNPDVSEIDYQRRFNFNGSELRPDFIVRFKNGKIAIVDAKYKFYTKFAYIKQDLQQICLYSRLKAFKKEYLKDYNVEPEIWIVCPSGEFQESEIEKNFSGISVKICPLPTV